MSEKILISLGMLSDEMIAEAITSSGTEHKKKCRKFIPAVASLLLIITGIIITIVCRNSQGIGIEVNPGNSQIASTENNINPAIGPLYVYYAGVAYVYRGYYNTALPEGFEYAGGVNNIGENIPQQSFDSNYEGCIYINQNNPDVIYFRWYNWDEELEGKPEPFLILKPEEYN